MEPEPISLGTTNNDTNLTPATIAPSLTYDRHRLFLYQRLHRLIRDLYTLPPQQVTTEIQSKVHDQLLRIMTQEKLSRDMGRRAALAYALHLHKLYGDSEHDWRNTIFKEKDTVLLYNDILMKKTGDVPDSGNRMAVMYVYVYSIALVYTCAEDTSHLSLDDILRGRWKVRQLDEGLLRDMATSLFKLARNVNEGDIRLEAAKTLAELIQLTTAKGIGEGMSRDMVKYCTKYALGDRQIRMRQHACDWLVALPYFHLNDIEIVLNALGKNIDSSDYYTRQKISSAMASLVFYTLHTRWCQILQRKQEIARSNTTMNYEKIAVPSFSYALNLLGSLMIRTAGQYPLSKKTKCTLAEAYTKLFKYLGTAFVNAHCTVIIQHGLDLLQNPKFFGITLSKQETLYNRHCCMRIWKTSINQLASEGCQLFVVKYLVDIIRKTTDHKAVLSKNALICILYQLASLFDSLGNILASIEETIRDPLFKIPYWPSISVQLAAAEAFKALARAVPPSLPKYIYRLFLMIEKQKSTLTIYEKEQKLDKTERNIKKKNIKRFKGHGFILAALTHTIADRPLYVSHELLQKNWILATKTLSVLSKDEDIVSAQLEFVWSLIGSLVSIGPCFAEPYLESILGLWKNVFLMPYNQQQLQQQGKQYNFDWPFFLSAREVALPSIYTFLTHCSSIINVEISKFLANCLNGSLIFLAQKPGFIKYPGLNTYRKRTLQCLSVVPISVWEIVTLPLMRSIVEVFAEANAEMEMTMLLRSACQLSHHPLAFMDDEWPGRTILYRPLQGSPKFDPSCLYCQNNLNDRDMPWPLESSIAGVDWAIDLFAKVFCLQTEKYQEQLMHYFIRILKDVKLARKHILQTNIFTALLMALHVMNERRVILRDSSVIAATQELLSSALVLPDPSVRIAAAEGLGRLAKACDNSTYTLALVKQIIDVMLLERESVPRAGYSLALGCIYKYAGGISGSAELKRVVGILQSLSSDLNFSVSRWALYSLWLVIEATGLLFAPLVNSTLSLIAKLFLSPYINDARVESLVLFGKLVASLVATLGAELQSASSIKVKELCWNLMEDILDSSDSDYVKLEGIRFMQSMALVDPLYENALWKAKNSSMKVICSTFDGVSSSSRLLDAETSLLGLALATLKNILQKEDSTNDNHKDLDRQSIEESLFYAYDNVSIEDIVNQKRLQDNLFICMLSAIEEKRQARWIDMCSKIIMKPIEEPELEEDQFNLDLPMDKSDMQFSTPVVMGNHEENDDFDKDPNFIETRRQFGFTIPSEKIAARYSSSAITLLSGRWKIKLYALECVKQFLQNAHSFSDLIPWLQDLLRMAFHASTSIVDDIRLSGFDLLELIIENFKDASFMKPDLGENRDLISDDEDWQPISVLHQYQALITGALGPAFSSEGSPSDPIIAAKACQVSAIYIASGVSRNAEDLQRVIKLLNSSLDKLQGDLELADLSPHAYTVMKLSILSSWADLCIKSKVEPYLVEIVEQHIPLLSILWLASIHSYAEIKFGLQCLMKQQRGINDAALRIGFAKSVIMNHYESSWPNILLALLDLVERYPDTVAFGLKRISYADKESAKYFYVLYGVAMEPLAHLQNLQDVKEEDRVVHCLHSLTKLFHRNVLGEQCAFPKNMFLEMMLVLAKIAQIDKPKIQYPLLQLLFHIASKFGPYLVNEISTTMPSPVFPIISIDSKLHAFLGILYSTLLQNTALLSSNSSIMKYMLKKKNVVDIMSLVECNFKIISALCMVLSSQQRQEIMIIILYLFEEILETFEHHRESNEKVKASFEELMEVNISNQDHDSAIVFQGLLFSSLSKFCEFYEKKDDASTDAILKSEGEGNRLITFSWWSTIIFDKLFSTGTNFIDGTLTESMMDVLKWMLKCPLIKIKIGALECIDYMLFRITERQSVLVQRTREYTKLLIHELFPNTVLAGLQEQEQLGHRLLQFLGRIYALHILEPGEKAALLSTIIPIAIKHSFGKLYPSSVSLMNGLMRNDSVLVHHLLQNHFDAEQRNLAEKIIKVHSSNLMHFRKDISGTDLGSEYQSNIYSIPKGTSSFPLKLDVRRFLDTYATNENQ